MAHPQDSAALVDQQVETNLLTPEAQPLTTWEGSGEALKGLLRPSAAAGRSLLIAAPAALEVFGSGLTDEGKDAYYSWVDDVSNRAVDYWTPDAQTLGGAAQVVNTVSQVIGSVPQIVGAPELFLTNAAFDQSTELVRQGVDSETAVSVGMVDLGVNALGLRIPPAFGSGIGTRVATGAGSNLVLGAGADAVSGALLESGGFSDLAAGYSWRDPSRRMLDVLMGGAFGLAPAAPKAAPSERNAILAARNAQHFQVETAPGIPADGASSVLHQDTLSAAVEQIIRGDRVDIADVFQGGTFYFSPGAAAMPARVATFDSAIGEVLRAEGGFVDDPVDRGGATKYGISQKAYPKLDIANLTEAQARELYKRDYWDKIDADALPESLREVAFDAAVNQGVGWTRKALKKAGGDAAEFLRLREARYREIVANDPSQAKFLDGWMNRIERFRGAADDVRVVVAEADAPVIPDLTPLDAARVVDERLSALDQLATTDLLSPAATAALRAEDAQLVQVLRKQERYQAGGIIPADPLARLSETEVRRVTERRIEIRDQLERSSAAAGYANVAQNLRQRLTKIDADRDLVSLAETLTGRKPRRQRQIAIPAAPPREIVDWLPPAAADLARSMQERERVYTAMAKQAGRELDVPNLSVAAQRLEQPTAPVRRMPVVEPSKSTAATPRATGDEAAAQPGQVAAEAPLQAAAKMAEEAPDTRVVVGQDADGQPIYSTLGDALETIENERQRAVRDAEAITAAANCAMRRAA